MPWVAPAVGLAISAYSAYKGSKDQKKAASQAAEAAKSATVDPQEIARIAREQAAQNIIDSNAAEQTYAPQNARFRESGILNLQNQLDGGDPTGDAAIAAISQELGMPPAVIARSPLLMAAIQKATSDLGQGGRLSVDTQNQVTRQGLAIAGQVGGGNLGAARYIVPRDLGISSLQLENSRLANAGTFGQMEQGLNTADVNSALQQSSLRAQLAAALSGVGNAQAQRNLSLASFGQTLQRPEVGLSPGDLASLYVQNASNSATAGQNAAAINAQTAKNTAGLYGGLGGAIGSFDWGKVFGGTGAATTGTPKSWDIGGRPVY